MPVFFFFNDTATTEIYTLSLHDALPISLLRSHAGTPPDMVLTWNAMESPGTVDVVVHLHGFAARGRDRKSTRLNSSHSQISYAVFCLKKKNSNADCRDVGAISADDVLCL